MEHLTVHHIDKKSTRNSSTFCGKKIFEGEKLAVSISSNRDKVTCDDCLGEKPRKIEPQKSVRVTTERVKRILRDPQATDDELLEAFKFIADIS